MIEGTQAEAVVDGYAVPCNLRPVEARCGMAATSVRDAALLDGPRSTVRARVLGGFDVVAFGRALTRADWRRTSARRLMKLLLVTPGHRVSREVAAEALWPGSRPDHSRTNLRKALHFVRLALGPDGPIVATNGSIALDPARIDVDLDWLEAAMAIVAEHAIEHRAGVGAALDRATTEILRLGGLDLLPDDPYEDWLVAPRERIRASWERIALHAAEVTYRAGRPADAHALVDRMLERDPADEAAHRLAIELYAAEGRHQAVREQIARCAAALREIDAEPSAETIAVFALGSPDAIRVAT